MIKTCPTNLPERCARYFRDGNRNEVISRVEVVFARFIDDPDEAVAVSPSVGDLPIDFSDVERGAIAPVAHTAFEAALELEFFLTDAMRLIPMNFRRTSWIALLPAIVWGLSILPRIVNEVAKG